MLAHPVLAADKLDQDKIKKIIALTTNEAAAIALASCLVSPSVDAESDPNCACALKLRDVKTEAGFKILFEDCKTLLAIKQTGERASAQSTYATNIRDVEEHVGKCWQISSDVIASRKSHPPVDINVQIDKKGHILRAEVEDKVRVDTDPDFEAYSILAKKALVDCSPLPISSGLIKLFPKFTFKFAPIFTRPDLLLRD